MQKLSDSQRLIKPGRALFATVGLHRVLEPGTLKITKAELADAAKLEPDLRAAVREFLDGKREDVPLPKTDADAVTKLLFRTMEPADIEDDLKQFRGNPNGDDFIAIASAAAAYLRTKVPRRFRLTFVGAQPLKPSQAELFAFRRFLETVSDPLWAIKQLLNATLGRDHIEALAAVWPDVLQTVRKAYEEEKAAKLDKDKSFQFTRRQNRQIAVLLQQDPTTPPNVLASLQASFAGEQAAADAKQASRKAPDDQELSTPVQRVAAKT